MGALELCDGKDNACAGVVPDEDTDGDGDGFSICEGDCDDTDDARFPANTETCDGVDNDCDATIPLDELDLDGDGVTECDGDCGPLDPGTHPSATEVCDGVDNDCDGEEDDETCLDTAGCGCTNTPLQVPVGLWFLALAAVARRRR